MTAQRLKRIFVDNSPRNLISRLRKKTSTHRGYLLRLSLLSAAMFLLYSFFGGDYGYVSLLRLQRQQSRLLAEKRQLIAEIADLEYRLRRIETDSLYIQKIARDRYGLARDDELIIRLPENLSPRP
jgi:cell division protein FtsB